MREFEFITFEQRNSNNILDVIPAGTNFFISQSAIEHFESDLMYFRHIKAFIDCTNNNTVQIYVFPLQLVYNSTDGTELDNTHQELF